MVSTVYIAISLSVIISLLIAVVAGKSHTDRNFSSQDYLFGGNNSTIGVLSSIGTYISSSIFIAGTLLAGYKYGLTMIHCFVAVSLIALALFCIAAYRTNLTEDGIGIIRYRTINELVAEKLGANVASFYLAMFIIYSITLISTELSVITYFYSLLIDNSLSSTSIITVFIALCCAFYSWHGGFRGILWTDVFQVGIFLVWFIMFLYAFNEHIQQYSVLGQISPILEASGSVKNKDYLDNLNNNAALTAIALFIYILTVLISCTGIWPRTIGTIKDKKKRYINIVFITIGILIINSILIYTGYCLRDPYLTMNFIALNYIEFPFLLITELCRHNFIFAGITSLAITSVCLTTVDTLVISIVQHYHTSRECFYCAEKKWAIWVDKELSPSSVIRITILAALLLSTILDIHTLYITLIFVFSALTIILLLVAGAVEKTHFIRKLERRYAFKLLFFPFKWNKCSLASIFMSMLFTFLIYYTNAISTISISIASKKIYATILIFGIYCLFNTLANALHFCRIDNND